MLQVLFDQVWIVGFRQAESFCHAFYMGINDHAGLAEGVAQYDIRGFSADAWQGEQLFHRARDPSLEAIGHGLAAGDEVFRFVLEETGGTNQLFQFRKIGHSHFHRCSIPLKE